MHLFFSVKKSTPNFLFATSSSLISQNGGQHFGRSLFFRAGKSCLLKSMPTTWRLGCLTKNMEFWLREHGDFVGGTLHAQTVEFWRGDDNYITHGFKSIARLNAGQNGPTNCKLWCNQLQASTADAHQREQMEFAFCRLPCTTGKSLTAGSARGRVITAGKLRRCERLFTSKNIKKQTSEENGCRGPPHRLKR